MCKEKQKIEISDQKLEEKVTIQDDLNKVYKQIEKLAELFMDRISYDETKEKALKYMDSQLEIYKQDYLFQLRKSLYFSFFELYDTVYQTRIKYAKEADQKIPDVVSILETQILDILAENEIFLIEKNGTPLKTFDSKYHKVLQAIKTDKKEEDYQIERIIKHGFLYKDKIIRLEHVTIFRYEEPKQ